MKNRALGIFVCTLLIATNVAVLADWNPGDGHKMHFPQLPDPNGWDVYATAGLSQYPNIVLADDWRCSETGFVKDIHFWGSWKGDIIGDIEYFVLAIHSDIPANPPNVPHSRPGKTLWEIEVDDWIERGPYTGNQGWFWPDGDYIPSDHDKYFQYNVFLDEEDWFPQEKGKIYWLAVSAVVEEVFGAVQPFWGWKSSENHWNDDACWSYWGDLNWQEMYEPGGSDPVTNMFWVELDSQGYPNEDLSGGTDYYDDGRSINGWYFYEFSEWWNIWFYDHPFDPERYKEIDVSFQLFKANPGMPSYVEIAINWATDFWEPGGPPPLPPLDPQYEDVVIGRYTLLESEEFREGFYEFPTFYIEEYNPEWVSMDVRGFNYRIVEGIIAHDCLPSTSQQSLDLAFVITGEETEEPSIDIDKKVSKDGGITWSDEVDVEFDDTVRFKITVENDGDVDLNYIQIVDTLPSCLEYADNAYPVEPIISGNKLTWIFTFLNVGQKKEIEFDAKAIETGENINEVSVTTYEEVSDSSTATVNVGEIPAPKIGCVGELRWSGIKPNSTVTGTIYAENIGDPGSKLKWKVCGNPPWGTWNFNPPSGTDLKPSDGLKAINVTVMAPNQQNQQFSGQITLCNEEDSTDTCTIQVSLATPKNKAINPLFLRFLEQYPHIYQILKYLLGI